MKNFCKAMILLFVLIFVVITACDVDGGYTDIIGDQGDTDGGNGDTTEIAVTGVTVTPETTFVAIGETVQLTATVAPANATNTAVTWTSGDENTATVSPSGEVTGVARGTVTITAASAEDAALKGTCVVTVAGAVVTLAENSDSNMKVFIGCDAGGNNDGLGQKVVHNTDYIPKTFSVSIHSTSEFINLDTADEVDVELQLRIWGDSGELYGSSSVNITAGQVGEVIFQITNSDTIPADTIVLYAVFLPDAATNRIRGQLDYRDSNLYGGSNAEINIFRTIDASDVTVDDYAEWQQWTDQDLKFTLAGSEL